MLSGFLSAETGQPIVDAAGTADGDGDNSNDHDHHHHHDRDNMDRLASDLASTSLHSKQAAELVQLQDALLDMPTRRLLREDTRNKYSFCVNYAPRSPYYSFAADDDDDEDDQMLSSTGYQSAPISRKLTLYTCAQRGIRVSLPGIKTFVWSADTFDRASDPYQHADGCGVLVRYLRGLLPPVPEFDLDRTVFHYENELAPATELHQREHKANVDHALIKQFCVNVNGDASWLLHEMEELRRLEMVATEHNWLQREEVRHVNTQKQNIGIRLHAEFGKLYAQHPQETLLPSTYASALSLDVDEPRTAEGLERVSDPVATQLPALLLLAHHILTAELKLSLITSEYPVVIPDEFFWNQTTPPSYFMAVTDFLLHAAADAPNELTVCEFKTEWGKLESNKLRRYYVAQAHMFGAMLQLELDRQQVKLNRTDERPLQIKRHLILLLRPKVGRVAVFEVPFDHALLRSMMRKNEGKLNPDFLRLFGHSPRNWFKGSCTAARHTTLIQHTDVSTTDKEAAQPADASAEVAS